MISGIIAALRTLGPRDVGPRARSAVCVGHLLLLAALAPLAAEPSRAQDALVLDCDKSWSGACGGTADNRAVNSCQSKGYNTTEVEGTSDMACRNALENGNYEVVVMIGHGCCDGDGPPLEGVKTRDGGTFSSTIFPLGTTFPNVKEVVILSCSQVNMASWRALFPNATIYGWSGPVSWLGIWGVAGHLPIAPAQKMRGECRVDEIPLSGYHSALWADPLVVPLYDGYTLNPPTPMNPVLQPYPALVDAFGSQVINVVIPDGQGGLPETMVGIEVTDGVITAYTELGCADPTFEILIPHADYLEALGTPNWMSVAYTEGRITINDLGAGLPADVLFQGAAGLLFGIYGLGDFDHDADVDASDFIALAGCYGGPGESGRGERSLLDCPDVFDKDEDTDVDLRDFSGFQSRFTGSLGP